MMDKLEKWTQYSPMSASNQAIFRIILCFVALFSLIGVLRIDTLSIFPSSFYQPQLGVASLFKKLPSPLVIQFLNVLNIISLVCVLFGFKTRLNSIIFGLGFILSTSFIYAFSKIGHQHIIPFTILIFAFSDWGKFYSIDSLKIQKNRNLSINIYPFLTLIIAFSFFTAGFSKILGDWLSLDFQASRYYIIQNHVFSERTNLLTNWAIYGVSSRKFWEFIDYLIVAIEILPLSVIFYPKLFRISMFFVATFHLITFLVMNITFGLFPLFYLPFIVDWKKSTIIKKIEFWLATKKVDVKKTILLFVLTIIIMVLLHLTINFNGKTGLSIHRGFVLVFAYILVLVFFLESIILKHEK